MVNGGPTAIKWTTVAGGGRRSLLLGTAGLFRVTVSTPRSKVDKTVNCLEGINARKINVVASENLHFQYIYICMLFRVLSQLSLGRVNRGHATTYCLSLCVYGEGITESKAKCLPLLKYVWTFGRRAYMAAGVFFAILLPMRPLFSFFFCACRGLTMVASGRTRRRL